ncbi:MAG: RNA pseudouridine synthase [Methyloprofundus sp.]|nr:RNA pseudouridine synthase [Methyloprofundus sp.]MBW6452283.1 RNA pseudouridine synthase [Methyloprofundus sp.]
MPLPDNHFIPFKTAIDGYALPERFTFPFYYQPHPLCLLATKELQQHLKSQQQWQHNFGLSGDETNAIGKMFGVLLVQNQRNEIGYLAAFSGKLAGQNHWAKFVPPVFDMLTEDSFFLAQQKQINQINQQIEVLENNPQLALLTASLQAEIDAAKRQLAEHREKIIAGRMARKAQRTAAAHTEGFLALKHKLGQESINEKLQLRDLNLHWNERIQKAEANLNKLTTELTALKNQRKDLSAALQKKLFTQYQFLNAQGQLKSLYDIFQATTQMTPPAGAGECATPKLLHYAFKHHLKPLAMAEFWWGASPKSEIRKHQNFYPACQGKCQPILEHMLAGLNIDDNPLLTNPALGKSIDIIYQDEVMLVINKPAEFLSVPGKRIEDCVYLRIKQSFPKATGPLIVHRLDMSTSGLMVIALSKEAHKALQKQFIKRTVKKRYVALLDGLIKQESGIIDLPLRVDLDDRPRQLVCYEHGKPAKTQWQVIEHKNQQTRIYFYPITGRTHQLRVHSAHIKGLNTAIVGDDLYGNKGERLHLHAETLEFTHPLTKELMCFQVDAAF